MTIAADVNPRVEWADNSRIYIRGYFPLFAPRFMGRRRQEIRNRRMYQITIERTFGASHSLKLLDNTIEQAHSHDWQVRLSVGRVRLDDMETVMDFHVLEELLDSVLDPWRGVHLNDVEPFARSQINPTAERVAWWIGKQIAERLPPVSDGVKLVAVTVEEASGCTASYRPQE